MLYRKTNQRLQLSSQIENRKIKPIVLQSSTASSLSIRVPTCSTMNRVKRITGSNSQTSSMFHPREEFYSPIGSVHKLRSTYIESKDSQEEFRESIIKMDLVNQNLESVHEIIGNHKNQTMEDDAKSENSPMLVIKSPLRTRRKGVILNETNKSQEHNSPSELQDFGAENLRQITRKDFYKCFKHIHQVQMANETYDQQDNIHVRFIKKSLDNLVIPKALPIITNTNNLLKKMNASAINKKSVQAAISTLSSPQCQQVDSVDISMSFVAKGSLQTLLQNVPEKLQNLNLQKSRIDIGGVSILGNFLKQHLRLKELNLEDNNFEDYGCKLLIDSIPENHQLSILNLSKNKLGLQTCHALVPFLRKTQNLRELYLHYNNINHIGGTILFKNLIKCSPLKVLDLSFNSLSNKLSSKTPTSKMDQILQDQNNCIMWLKRFLSKTELVHMDLSFNNFTLIECQEISKGVSENRNVFGFHFEGNHPQFLVDKHGNLINWNDIHKTPKLERFLGISLNAVERPYIHKVQESNPHPLNRVRRIKGVQTNIQQNKSKYTNLDTCWICDGWQEVKITWTPNQSGRLTTEPIFIHLSIFEYQPYLMTKQKNQFVYFFSSPPDIQINYFFTNPVLGVQTVARDQIVDDKPLEGLPQHFIYNQAILVDRPVLKRYNTLSVESNKRVILAQKSYTTSVFVMPREPFKFYDFSPYVGRWVVGWQVENSFFSNYDIGLNSKLDKCFINDWEASKIQKMIQDQQETKDLLRYYYPFIYKAYKRMIMMPEDIPFISLQQMNTLMNKLKLFDNRFRPTDLEVLFLSSSQQNFPMTAYRGIVRHQFMELILRIANDKHCRYNTIKSVSHAIKTLFEDDGLLNYFSQLENPQDWRDQRFWTEECDQVINKRMPFLKSLYKFICQLSKKKSEYISKNDFIEFFLKLELVAEDLTESDIFLVFNQSLSIQTNELYSARFTQMNFFEFLEGLARIAERISFVLPTKRQSPQHILSMDFDIKTQLPLYRKLSGLIYLIYFKLADHIRLVSQNENDWVKFDKCMVREKEFEKIKNDIRHHSMPTFQIKNLSVIQKSNSFSSSDESDDSAQINIKNDILQKQCDQRKIQTMSNTNAKKNQTLRSTNKLKNILHMNSFLKFVILQKKDKYQMQ